MAAMERICSQSPLFFCFTADQRISGGEDVTRVASLLAFFFDAPAGNREPGKDRDVIFFFFSFLFLSFSKQNPQHKTGVTPFTVSLL
jgi:hypothetical protein